MQRLICLSLLLFTQPIFAGERIGSISFSRCNAETVCADGRKISCEVFGDSNWGKACVWVQSEGHSVTCSGQSESGSEVQIHIPCDTDLAEDIEIPELPHLADL